MAVTFEAVRRSRLKERYALLWMFTGALILICAFFPVILDFLTALLGLQYVTAVGVVMFIFFLLLLFHVSLALSNIQEDETATADPALIFFIKAGRRTPRNNISSTTGAARIARDSRSARLQSGCGSMKMTTTSCSVTG